MKDVKGTVLLSLIAMVLMSSCSPKIPLTNEVRKKYNITVEDMKRLQFYNSQEIVLYSVKSDGSIETNKGELVISSDKEEDNVIFKRNTPGILEQAISEEKLKISFELGDGKVIVFGPQGSKGYYHLMAEEWKNNNGKLTYAGETYYASPGSGNAYLTFRLRKLTRYQKKERVAKGVKLK